MPTSALNLGLLTTIIILMQMILKTAEASSRRKANKTDSEQVPYCMSFISLYIYDIIYINKKFF